MFSNIKLKSITNIKPSPLYLLPSLYSPLFASNYRVDLQVRKNCELAHHVQ